MSAFLGQEGETRPGPFCEKYGFGAGALRGLVEGGTKLTTAATRSASLAD